MQLWITWSAQVKTLWDSKLQELHLVVCESADPLQGSKSPKSGKEGFGVKKLPFPIVPEKGGLSPIIPISLQGATRKMGIVGLKPPFSGTIGNGSFFFFDPETLFSRFWGF